MSAVLEKIYFIITQKSHTVAMDKVIKEIGGSRERDQFTVVLEAIQMDFRAFGERLDMVEERLGARIDGVEAGLGVRVDILEERLEGLSAKIDRLTSEVDFIKNEIVEIRKELNQKADAKRLEELERRVRRIEEIIGQLDAVSLVCYARSQNARVKRSLIWQK